jgi:hypothetical protein
MPYRESASPLQTLYDREPLRSLHADGDERLLDLLRAWGSDE